VWRWRASLALPWQTGNDVAQLRLFHCHRTRKRPRGDPNARKQVSLWSPEMVASRTSIRNDCASTSLRACAELSQGISQVRDPMTPSIR
jgi:hypothetical protein